MTYYVFLLGMGAVISQLRLARVVPVSERNTWLAGGIGILLAALAGARITYCLERFSYFSHRPLEVAAFWLGGLAWQGAVIGAWAAIVIWFLTWQRPFSQILDKTGVMLLPVAVAVWLGAWTEGLAYGEIVPAGAWWGLPSMDVHGVASLHFPLQLIASMSLLILIAVVESFVPRLKLAGVTGSLTWLVFSIGMILFTILRVDPSPLLLGLRLESWYAILFTGIALFLFLEMLFAAKTKIAKTLPVPMDELKEGLL